MNPEVLKAWSEARELKKTIRPLTALLLIMEYSFNEIDKDVDMIETDQMIDRLSARVYQAYDLISHQRGRIERRQDLLHPDSFEITYCDFKDVMKILDMSRSKIETLINSKKITAVQNHPGEKRRFIKEDILKYRAGLKR